MTKVFFRRSNDERYYSIAAFDLDVIPREGEKIELMNNDERSLWFVLYVSHELYQDAVGNPDHIVYITVSPHSELQHDFWVEWLDPATRPNWIPDEAILECNVLLRSGELLEIGINDRGFDPNDVVTVEIVAVVHNALMEPLDEVNIGHIGEMQSALVVRNVDRSPHGDVQRAVFRRN
jgi:hypothetical protein